MILILDYYHIIEFISRDRVALAGHSIALGMNLCQGKLGCGPEMLGLVWPSDRMAWRGAFSCKHLI